MLFFIVAEFHEFQILRLKCGRSTKSFTTEDPVLEIVTRISEHLVVLQIDSLLRRIHATFPSVRSHGTLAMILVNLAKSWLTMVSLSRSWQIMIHGTLVKIMARSLQDLDKITMIRHVSWY